MRVSGIQRAIVAAAALVAALGASACEDVKDPVTFDPTPVTFTETFSGTLATGGVNTHPFANTIAGTVTLTLVTVSPDSAQALGLDIGTWDTLTSTCSPIFGTGSRSATQGYAFSGSAIAANFCVRVFDAAGAIPADTQVAYTVTVAHR